MQRACAAFEFGADAMVALLLLLLPQLPATGLPFRNLSGTVPLPSDPHLEWHHAELGALISSGMGGSVGQESSPCVAHSPYPLAPPAACHSLQRLARPGAVGSSRQSARRKIRDAGRERDVRLLALAERRV